MYVTKSIDILNKNTPGVKKGEAKSEATKVTLIIYSTKKIDSYHAGGGQGLYN